jgi:preprotein translocase subunit SecB
MEQPVHPISLDKVFFTRSVVIAVPGHVPNGTLAEAPENKIDLEKVDGERRLYQATMRTLQNSKADTSMPYVIDVECVGLFLVDESLTDEEANRGVMITAHSVLYGAIREAVAWITGRQPYGQLMLGLSILRSQPPVAVE